MCNYFFGVIFLKYLNENINPDIVETSGLSSLSIKINRLMLRNEESEIAFANLMNKYDLMKNVIIIV